MRRDKRPLLAETTSVFASPMHSWPPFKVMQWPLAANPFLVFYFCDLTHTLSLPEFRRSILHLVFKI